VLWVIVSVVLVLLVVVVAWSWRRSMQRLRATFAPETLALMESMIPPEVRARDPRATVGDGLTAQERKLIRGQRNLVIFLVILPAAAFVALQIWEPSVDTSVTIGETARIAPLVLALPALAWTRRRVRKAAAAGDDRWEVLGLHMEATPEVVILPRFTGGLRATAFGTSVLSGTRFGRAVRIEWGDGLLCTAVHAPDVPTQAPSEPGPDGSTLHSQDGWVVLTRPMTNANLVGPTSMATVLHDLAHVEEAADQAPTAGS
jgi:hypothetical protein